MKEPVVGVKAFAAGKIELWGRLRRHEERQGNRSVRNRYMCGG